jgi:membrane fusion protein (multidrug efflux system)
MKRILISFLLLAVAIGVGWYFLAHRETKPANDEEKPAAKVETTTLVEKPISKTIEVFGSVITAPSGEQMTPAPYDVVVRKVHVSVGTTVKAGEVLLEVEPSPDVRLAADSARSARSLAEKTLAGTRERYDLRLATRQELQAAEQVVEDAKLKEESFSARGLGGDGRIAATYGGVVSKLDFVAGSPVAIGTPLVTVSTDSELEVRLGVEAADLPRVVSGQPVELESSNRSAGEKVMTTVRTVGAALDSVTGAAEARAALPKGAPLFLGEHVKAHIEIAKKERAMVVPRSAVLPDNDKQILFTVKNGKAVRHEVNPGLANADSVEITGEGLVLGDVVVTLGNYELEDGMAVQGPEEETKKADEESVAKPAGETKP